MGKYEKPQRNDVNSTERSDILVFNCYLCPVRFLLTCYVCSTKIGEISDISKCFENFVFQALGVLTRIYAAELRNKNNSEDQIIERLDQWWKAFITNKFGKKSESKTKKR